MTQPTIKTPISATFVVRFWREWSAGEVRWRGRVEHVGSGRQQNFLEVEDMVRFFERFGVESSDSKS